MYTLQSINNGKFLNIYFEESKFNCYLIDKIGQMLVRGTKLSYKYRIESNDIALSYTCDFTNNYEDAYIIVPAIKI